MERPVWTNGEFDIFETELGFTVVDCNDEQLKSFPFLIEAVEYANRLERETR